MIQKIKENYIVSHDDIFVTLEVDHDEGTMSIFSEKDKPGFYFKDMPAENNWIQILDCMQDAVSLGKELLQGEGDASKNT